MKTPITNAKGRFLFQRDVIIYTVAKSGDKVRSHSIVVSPTCNPFEVAASYASKNFPEHSIAFTFPKDPEDRQIFLLRSRDNTEYEMHFLYQMEETAEA